MFADCATEKVTVIGRSVVLQLFDMSASTSRSYTATGVRVTHGTMKRGAYVRVVKQSQRENNTQLSIEDARALSKCHGVPRALTFFFAFFFFCLFSWHHQKHATQQRRHQAGEQGHRVRFGVGQCARRTGRRA